ncbi:DUF1657 domain-containing protein [Sporosalibacterium faouarense]|uniref:DUF1657 domain-containing protein n=1 Tax=Sporosalibacterium faouarense TaxID=516123 RepID=UPI00141C123A|nr:DUF1657 domain-containing protein [Sporosalibacterium faouarense]MTI48708.1 DUF1657 domain-containing protein [Bacillota bacterium]
MTIHSQVTQTLANLKGIKATLSTYQVQEKNEDTKNIIKESVKETNEIIKDLENRIKTLELEEPQYKGY